MAQEFTIKSEEIESKINQLLPSQGGFGAGVDFSASTMVIPIVDLTETAEGSGLRQDLQSSLSHGNTTSFQVSGATTTIITTTGYFRLFGVSSILSTTATQRTAEIIINDGTTDKIVYNHTMVTSPLPAVVTSNTFDFIVFLSAGDSVIAKTLSTGAVISGSSRQLADISGNLVNP